ncbi:MAG TPA: sigma-70 family RNA polymerase sigma factor [Polyangia bacterium]|nr:sigma-70 family RNA polymerase sigma factor [Polyangia bacterium]
MTAPIPTLTPEAIRKEAVSRPRAAFLAGVERLVHANRLSLAAVARHEGLGPEDALDAVQEAFQTFLARPEAARLVEEPEQARHLLTTLTRNVARNRRRIHAVARPHLSDAVTLDALPADVADVEETLAAAEQHVRLAGCMLTLAEIPRTVVTLRMLDELPGEDVARLLGVSPGHVAVMLHRAKASLLTCMTTCGTVPGRED